MISSPAASFMIQGYLGTRKQRWSRITTNTLLQTGDLVEGKSQRKILPTMLMIGLGASFDNWLDAVDGSFCTFENGDNPISFNKE